MTHTDTRAAMADQAKTFREPTQEQIDQRARQLFSRDNRYGFGFFSPNAVLRMMQCKEIASIDLRANADRLEKRTEEHIDMLPSISKHNGMVTPAPDNTEN